MSSYMNDLDAVTYFYTSSGIALGVTALLFFIFGVWFGKLTWGRYKKRAKIAQKNVDLLKTEVANLKRRLAEQASRPMPAVVSSPGYTTPSASPALLSAFAASSPTTQAAPVSEANQAAAVTDEKSEVEPLPETAPPPIVIHQAPVQNVPSASFASQSNSFTHPVLEVTPLPALPDILTDEHRVDAETIAPPVLPDNEEDEPLFPLAGVERVDKVLNRPSRAFTVWTEKGWKAEAVTPLKFPPSTAFSLWTAEDFVVPFAYYHFPSRAFTLWTEKDWTLPLIAPLKMPPSQGYTLWTTEDFNPRVSYFQRPGAGFTLWTEPGWSPLKTLNPPLRSARSFTLWLDGEWVAPGPVKYPSQAFSLWTQPDWIPVPPQKLAFPPSSAFSVWIEDGWSAPGPVVWPGKAFSIWTEPDWLPTERTHPVYPRSQAFSLWMVTNASEAALLAEKKEPIGQAEAASVPPPIDSTPALLHLPNEKAEAAKTETPKGNVLVRFFKKLLFKAGTELGLPEKEQLITPAWLSNVLPEEKLVSEAPQTTPAAEKKESESPVTTASSDKLEEKVSPSPSHAFTVWTEPPPNYQLPPEAFSAELQQGAMRNDFLLGMVYVHPPLHRDDLTVMHGIAETMQRHLNNHGVYTFKQIAFWTPLQVDNFCHRLVAHGRIRSENWVGQARKFYEEKLAAQSQEVA